MSFKIVVIGTSLGGLNALQTVLRALPRDFPLPVAVVQHRERNAKEILTTLLQSQSPLPVKEVSDKDAIVPGMVFIAPADYHMLIDPPHFALSLEAPVHQCRPSIDVLFRTAAEAYGRGVIGILMTGANEDGAEGLATISEMGGYTIVQDPATAESAIMPAAALSRMRADAVLPLEKIGSHVLELSTGIKGKRDGKPRSH